MMKKWTVALYLKLTQMRKVTFWHIPLWFNTLSPGPWQDKGVHHPLISLAFKHLPKKDKKMRFAIPREWIRSGFELWSREVFVAIFIFHGWVGRKCEFLSSATSNHQITWGEVDFIFVNSAKQEVVMPLAGIITTPCDIVQIRPRSRKHQAKGEVREIPPQVNFTKLANPADGLKS